MPRSSNKEESNAVIDMEVSETVDCLFSAVTTTSSMPPLFVVSSSSALKVKPEKAKRLETTIKFIEFIFILNPK